MKKQQQAVTVLSICLIFLFLKYIAQLYPSLISSTLMQQFQLSGLQIGILASSYYYSYTLMQIISGVLLDRYDLKILSFLAILIIALGLWGFAYTNSFVFMCFYRILMGIGCSFATVLYIKTATIWTSAKTFTFISSLLATATMLGAAVGAEPIALLFNQFGWQHGLVYIAFLSLILAFLALFYIRNNTSKDQKTSASFEDIKKVLMNPANFWLLIYSGITFSPLVIFGGLWGVPFLQLKFNAPASHVAILISIMFIGHAIGSPIWALLSTALQNKKSIMISANVFSFFCLNLTLFAPLTYLQAEIVLFTFGFCVGSFMLSFDICRKVNPVIVMAFAASYMNSGEGIIGTFLEPLIGLLLDITKAPGATEFSLKNQEVILTILPFCYIFSTLIIFKLPFTNEVPILFKTFRIKQLLKVKNN